jgi:hypothetical protein
MAGIGLAIQRVFWRRRLAASEITTHSPVVHRVVWRSIDARALITLHHLALNQINVAASAATACARPAQTPRKQQAQTIITPHRDVSPGCTWPVLIHVRAIATISASHDMPQTSACLSASCGGCT